MWKGRHAPTLWGIGGIGALPLYCLVLGAVPQGAAPSIRPVPGWWLVARSVFIVAGLVVFCFVVGFVIAVGLHVLGLAIAFLAGYSMGGSEYRRR